MPIDQPILVTGASGMLGQSLVRLLTSLSLKVVATDREVAVGLSEALDITDYQEVVSVFNRIRPATIINCAAYTDVDGAESNQAQAFLVNSAGIGNLALAARNFGAKLVHFSTDYVFGLAHQAKAPLLETQLCDPQSVYGLSKFHGEILLQQILPGNHLLIRTSWLHGIGGPNFIDTMLRLSKERSSLSVVDDQVGSPTFAPWLAEMTVKLLEQGSTGVYHASSRGGISWFDLACEIFGQAGIDIEVQRQSTEELGRPAKRPQFSTLDVSKLEKTLSITAPSWQESVRLHLQARGVVQ